MLSFYTHLHFNGFIIYQSLSRCSLIAYIVRGNYLKHFSVNDHSILIIFFSALGLDSQNREVRRCAQCENISVDYLEKTTIDCVFLSSSRL